MVAAAFSHSRLYWPGPYHLQGHSVNVLGQPRAASEALRVLPGAECTQPLRPVRYEGSPASAVEATAPARSLGVAGNPRAYAAALLLKVLHTHAGCG